MTNPEKANQLSSEDQHQLARWRLVLGRVAEEQGVACGSDERCQRIEDLVGFLFDPEASSEGGRGDRQGGPGGHSLSIPD